MKCKYCNHEIAITEGPCPMCGKIVTATAEGESKSTGKTPLKCPQCEYERKPTDKTPEWQCPSCHIAYNKHPNSKTEPTIEIFKDRRRVPRNKPVRRPFIVWAFLVIGVVIIILYSMNQI